MMPQAIIARIVTRPEKSAGSPKTEVAGRSPAKLQREVLDPSRQELVAQIRQERRRHIARREKSLAGFPFSEFGQSQSNPSRYTPLCSAH
jgi:hypothetical protein